jgi:thymidylate synthase (FAD)
MTLSLNAYTQWYWKIDLHNLLHFLRLRAEAHAQYEIRVYADLLLGIIQKWVPLTHEAFQDYKMNAVTLSAHALDVVRQMINGEYPQQPESGLSKREWMELMTIFHKNEA